MALTRALTRVLAIALLLATPAALSAQDAERSEAMWLGLGLGAGSVALDCAGCADNRDEGVTGYLRFGGALTPDLLAGLELNTWLRRNDALDQRVQSLTALAHYYPMYDRGLWLGVQAGFARYSEKFENPDADVATSGAVVGASLGWELWLRPTLSIEPSVTWLRQLTGELEMNGFSLREPARLDLVQAGIGIIWRRD